MKRLLVILVALMPWLCATAAEQGDTRQGVTFELRNEADSMLYSALNELVPAEKYIWNWRDAIVLKGAIHASRVDSRFELPVTEWIARAIDVMEHRIHGVHPNGVASGAGLAFMMSREPDNERYAQLAQKVYSQYRATVRAENGACSHRPKLVELWDDTVYMLGLFLLEMYETTGDDRYLNDYVAEVLAHAEHLADAKSGFWYHGWSASRKPTDDACCQHAWNDNADQRNHEFWGRGNGWIAMSLADLLAVLPADHESYKEVKALFTKMTKSILRTQDKATGHWRQLPIHVGDGDKGNFIESSATAMFGYALARGVRCGVLPAKCEKAARRAYDGMLRLSVRPTERLMLTLDNVCAGTCIGDKEYYYKRQVTRDESFATGSWLLLAYELQALDK